MQSENLNTGQSIDSLRELLADRVVDRQDALRPALATRRGDPIRARRVEDVKCYLDCLAEAIAAGRSQLFADYIAWAKVTLHAQGVPDHELADSLELCRETIEGALPHSQSAIADRYISDSLLRLPALPTAVPSYFDSDRPLADLAREYLSALLESDRRKASELVMNAVGQGTSIQDIYLHVFQQSQYEIGRLWQANKISIAQEHLCTAATQLIMSQLYPLIFASERKNWRVVAACVGGDLHEIGIRMIADFFEMAGWDSFYLGADVPNDGIVQTVIDRDAHVLAVSTTLTTNISSVTRLIAEVRSNHQCDHTIILVGGHPFQVAPDLWREVGADAQAADAAEAIELAEHLLLEEVVT